MSIPKDASPPDLRAACEPNRSVTGGPSNGAQPPTAPESPPRENKTPVLPMHHLPRGKNTWNPRMIRQWWFWPASAAALYVLYHVYPLIWQWLAD